MVGGRVAPEQLSNNVTGATTNVPKEDEQLCRKMGKILEPITQESRQPVGLQIQEESLNFISHKGNEN